MNPLISLLSDLGTVSEELEQQICSKLKFASFPKKDFILRQGNICNHLFFVTKGVLRAYYDKDGEEITSWFMMENDFIVSVLSFFQKIPSYESIQALEDCDLMYIHRDDLLDLYANSLEFNIIGRKLTEHYYCRSEERLMSIRKQKAPEKYDFLLQNHPEILKRVPLKFIASYLGISSETFSRARGILRNIS